MAEFIEGDSLRKVEEIISTGVMSNEEKANIIYDINYDYRKRCTDGVLEGPNDMSVEEIKKRLDYLTVIPVLKCVFPVSGSYSRHPTRNRRVYCPVSKMASGSPTVS